MNLNELKINELKQIASNLQIEVAGDKRRKQTWIDAISSHLNKVQAEAVEFDSFQDQPVILGDYSSLYGSETYQIIQRHVITEFSQNIDLTRSFYARAIALEMATSDPTLEDEMITGI